MTPSRLLSRLQEVDRMLASTLRHSNAVQLADKKLVRTFCEAHSPEAISLICEAHKLKTLNLATRQFLPL